MYARYTSLIVLILVFSGTVLSQRPGRPPGPPGGHGLPGGIKPTRDGRPQMGENRPDGPPHGDWIRPHDANDNGILESDEFAAAIERTFAEFDKNGNGTIESGEHIRPRPPAGHRPGQDGKRLLPPFFFDEGLNSGKALSRSEFETLVRAKFNEMDKNRDGSLTRDESRPGRGPQPGKGRNATFIAAELRFGDKLIKGQPFSAETVIEDTRRLFDGSTVTKQRRGAFYRSTDGRTRREQPLEMIGGVSILGADNKPPMLVFINDFADGSQVFLDIGAKIARRHQLGSGGSPMDQREPQGAKTESLGTKSIDGVTVEGTRTTHEIPAGDIGNDKPIEVVSERWFSPEMQVIVMSRHLDPVAGEHTFKLVNIKRAEPPNDLFAIPAGFKIENSPPRRKDNE